MTDPAHRSLADTPRVHARVSAIVPARNEALCIGSVVRGLLRLRSACGLPLIFEVVVADNGSSDTTAEVALAAGARVLHVPQPGYGNACWHAAQASRGDVLLFVDGDGAADPQDASVLLAALDRGADLVIGVRQRPEPGAMSAAQRFGNALACTLMRWLWRMPVSDLGPYRAIRRDAFDALDLHDRSFGWTVEMQVRAFVLAQRVVERPVAWHARAAGVSKISGTLRGVFGAGIGILGMIARLWWHERQRAAPPAPKEFSPGTRAAAAAPAHLLPPH
jgi:glycosyltransferase involved in cell wall biosynthesis